MIIYVCLLSKVGYKMEFSFFAERESQSVIKRFPAVTIQGFLHGKGQLSLDKNGEKPVRTTDLNQVTAT